MKKQKNGLIKIFENYSGNCKKITVKVIKTANDATEVAGIRGKMIEMMAEQLAGCCILDDESSNKE